MGVPEPSKQPEWASANPFDPIPGEFAIVEPSEAKKDSGHLHKERPPRQDFNWLFNLIWEWIKHFKSRIAGVYINLNTVITAGGLTPDVEDSDQLKTALDTLYLGFGSFVQWSPTWVNTGGGTLTVNTNEIIYQVLGGNMMHIVGRVIIDTTITGLIFLDSGGLPDVGGKSTHLDDSVFTGSLSINFEKSKPTLYDFVIAVAAGSDQFYLVMEPTIGAVLADEAFFFNVMLPVKFV